MNKALGKLALAGIESQTRFRLGEKLAYKVMGEQLFNSACDWGWLNLVDRDADTNDPVYAFFHPSFQEYFAATAIDDWHFFLNHIPKNPRQGTYRIFEPQWKEVILLWLGQPEENQSRQQKEAFIKALVEFDDGCGQWLSQEGVDKGFYEYRAYFLAAAAIAEFGDCSKADEIVKQIVEWGFGYLDEKQEWQGFLYPIAMKARVALQETERTKAILALVQLLKSTPDRYIHIRRPAAESLWKINQGNEMSISALVQLLELTRNRFTQRQLANSLREKIGTGNKAAIAALIKLLDSTREQLALHCAIDNLGEIGADNETAIAALVQLLESTQDKKIRWHAAERLGEIGADNETAIAALVQLLESTSDENTRWHAAESLGKIDPGNETAIAELVKLLESTEDEDTRRRAAEMLGKIDPGNKTAIAALVQLLESTPDENTRCHAAESLGKIGTGNETAILALVQLLGSTPDTKTRWHVAESLGKIDPGNETAISALVQLLESTPDEKTRWHVAESLGKIDPGNETAISALVNLLGSTQNIFIHRGTADSLGEIGTGNKTAISALVQLLESTEDEDTSRRAAESLWKIDPGNETAISALVQLLESTEDRNTRMQAAESLWKIDPGNETAISALVQLLGSTPGKYTRCHVAKSLGKIGTGNETAIAELVKLLGSTQDKYTHWQVADSLKKIMRFHNFAEVVFALKKSLNDSQRFNEQCYAVVWHCAQNMTYPTFYQAWHKDTLDTSGTQSLDLADLPRILTEEIAKNTVLQDKVQLIYIDGSKIIDRDNPALEIYDQMLDYHCSERPNGEPETMPSLKSYWHSLQRNSNKLMVLVFYDSTSLEPEWAGFSQSLLDALKTFKGATCVVTEQPVGNLKQFSFREPHLVENLVGWITSYHPD